MASRLRGPRAPTGRIDNEPVLERCKEAIRNPPLHRIGAAGSAGQQVDPHSPQRIRLRLAGNLVADPCDAQSEPLLVPIG